MINESNGLFITSLIKFNLILIDSTGWIPSFRNFQSFTKFFYVKMTVIFIDILQVQDEIHPRRLMDGSANLGF